MDKSWPAAGRSAMNVVITVRNVGTLRSRRRRRSSRSESVARTMAGSLTPFGRQTTTEQAQVAIAMAASNWLRPCCLYSDHGSIAALRTASSRKVDVSAACITERAPPPEAASGTAVERAVERAGPSAARASAERTMAKSTHASNALLLSSRWRVAMVGARRVQGRSISRRGWFSLRQNRRSAGGARA